MLPQHDDLGADVGMMALPAHVHCLEDDPLPQAVPSLQLCQTPYPPGQPLGCPPALWESPLIPWPGGPPQRTLSLRSARWLMQVGNMRGAPTCHPLSPSYSLSCTYSSNDALSWSRPPLVVSITTSRGKHKCSPAGCRRASPTPPPMSNSAPHQPSSVVVHQPAPFATTPSLNPDKGVVNCTSSSRQLLWHLKMCCESGLTHPSSALNCTMQLCYVGSSKPLTLARH